VDFPPLSDIARLWYAGPNSDRIAAIQQQFLHMDSFDQALFLLGLDLEEGVLPLIHPGGRASRQRVVNDDRLIAGGGCFDYRDTIAAGRSAASPSPPSSPSSGAAAAEAPPSARELESPPTVTGKISPMSAAEVLFEDLEQMAIWFPTFQVHQMGDRGALPRWQGVVEPLGPRGGSFVLECRYLPNPLAPLAQRVLQPALHPLAPHRYTTGDLCTFYPPLGSWVRGRAGDDVVELLRFAITWLARYICWLRFGGWWPGVDVPHDPAFLVATLNDQDLCPYHSPERWGDCCKAAHVSALAGSGASRL
jgi:hypothetical protein